MLTMSRLMRRSRLMKALEINTEIGMVTIMISVSCHDM